jgi:hypothetical protein
MHGKVTRKLPVELPKTDKQAKMSFFFFFYQKQQTSGQTGPVWVVGTSGRGRIWGKGVGR